MKRNPVLRTKGPYSSLPLPKTLPLKRFCRTIIFGKNVVEQFNLEVSLDTEIRLYLKFGRYQTFLRILLELNL